MTHLDLFSGIGGFALATEYVWPDIQHTFCEIDPFCQAVLKKHWPTSKIYGDIRSLTNAGSQKLGGVSQQPRQADTQNRSCDLITGGFPCQPFSHAGRRRGTEDDRHLWPEMRRVISEFSPRWVVGENVRGLLSNGGGLVFEQICLDLEALGYEVQPFIIPACAVNAPHRRDRVWVVARHAEHDGRDHAERRKGDSERTEESPREKKMEQPKGPALSWDLDASTPELTKGRLRWGESWPTVAARLCALDDGLPGGLVRPHGWRNASLKAAGNAIVPQVAAEIFNAIRNYELNFL